MDSELKSLEAKINQFVALYQRLRADNHHLRQELAAAQNESKQLAEKIVAAKSRLETVLAQMPEEEV